MPSESPVTVCNNWTVVKAGPFTGRVSNLTHSHVIVTVATSEPAQLHGVALDDSLPIFLQAGEILYARSHPTGIVRVDEEIVQVFAPTLALQTDTGGPHARMCVDNGSTSFFAGREFSMFDEFNLVIGLSAVYRIQSAVPIMVVYASGQAWTGNCRIEIILEGGTEGGSFATPVSTMRTNRMPSADLAYASQVVVTTGGTLTGGTMAEATELISGIGSDRHQEIVTDIKPYGLAAGVYYVKITALGVAVHGALNIRWEERP